MIEVEDLVKRFVVRRGRFRRRREVVEAVRGVSFGVERGTIVGYIGPNGAGKSTTEIAFTIRCSGTDGRRRPRYPALRRRSAQRSAPT